MDHMTGNFLNPISIQEKKFKVHKTSARKNYRSSEVIQPELITVPA